MAGSGLDATPTPRDQAVQVLTEWLRDGVLPAGQPLPAQRVLAERLGVSQATVRRAIHELTRTGLLGEQRGHTRLVPGRAEPAPPLALRDTVLVIGQPKRPGDQISGGFSYVSYGLQDELLARGYHAMVLHPARLTPAQFRQHLQLHPLGLAMPDYQNARNALLEQERLALEAGLPMVVYGDGPDARTLDRVVSDHGLGVRLLIEELLRRGRRRFLMILPQEVDSYWTRARRAGYEQTLAEAGLEPLPTLTMPAIVHPPGTSFAQEGETATRLLAGYLVEHLLRPDPVDALLAINDWQVPWLDAACRLLGGRPRETIDIAGYDNVWHEAPMLAQLPSPTLTVDKLNRQSGQAMIELLFDRLGNVLPPGPARRVMPPHLVVPGATAWASAAPSPH